MANDPDRIEHPILGTLVWSERDSHWDSERHLPSGASVEVWIEPEDEDRHAFLTRAAQLLPWAMANERRILAEAMRAELLELYNGTWRQDGPPLPPEELTARLGWTLLIIRSSEFMPVEFSYHAAELFGGHSLTIEVDDELKYRDVDLI